MENKLGPHNWPIKLKKLDPMNVLLNNTNWADWALQVIVFKLGSNLRQVVGT